MPTSAAHSKENTSRVFITSNKKILFCKEKNPLSSVVPDSTDH